MLYIALLLVSLLSADYVLASTDYTDEPAGYNQLLRHRFNDKTNGGTRFDYYPDSSGLYAFIRSEANGTRCPDASASAAACSSLATGAAPPRWA